MLANIVVSFGTNRAPSSQCVEIEKKRKSFMAIANNKNHTLKLDEE
jgi:hypothetical protein